MFSHQVSLKDKLCHPFAAKDHDMHPYFGFVYLREDAIAERLDSVLGVENWDLVVTGTNVVPAGIPSVEITKGSFVPVSMIPDAEPTSGKYVLNGKELPIVWDIPYATASGFLRVRVDGRESVRYGIGADVLTNLGREHGARMMNTEKAAHTDLLKRCARLFGVGRYLLGLSGMGKMDQDSLKGWLNSLNVPLEISEAKRRITVLLGSKLTPEQIRDIIVEHGITEDHMLYANDAVIKYIHQVAPAAAA